MRTGGLRQKLQHSLREVIFGLEDALVSTLGATTGIAIGTGNANIVILSGLVLIFVEALSMTAGSFLSSKAANQVETVKKARQLSKLLQKKLSSGTALKEFLEHKCGKKKSEEIIELLRGNNVGASREKEKNSPFTAAIVMGAFYLLGGFFPLIPYFFFDVHQAILPSVLLTGMVLFAVGAWKAKLVKVDVVKSGLEMVTISLTAALLGYLIGRFASQWLGTAPF